MERVTQKNGRGYYLLGDGIYSDWGVPEKFRGDAVDRLAAYEGTGLEPEEIKATFTPEAVIKLAAQALGTTPDRLRELAQADREKNDPLTLDELRGMRGKWVWVVSPDKDLTVSAWAYVGANHVFTYWEYDNDELVGRVVYNLCDYGAWIAYRNPIKTVMPGEEQHGV
ncbi:Uncharacterised protein [uncultured Clostridium sp.]|nr:Uncharacterised protein [uncultured Clostridium sp.]